MTAEDQWVRAVPLTEEELEEEKVKLREHYAPHGFDIGTTCEECGLRFTCKLAFDAYNTNGDCLLSK